MPADSRTARSGLDLTLYAIVDLSVVPIERASEMAQAAVAGGATVVQLRGKDVQAGRLLVAAEQLAEVLTVPLIVNDRVDVAALVAADGVHLGDADLGLEAARRMLPGAILGRTVRTPAAAAAAQAAGADYLGVGSVAASGSKRGAPCIGPAGLEAVAASTACPVVAIGGIDRDLIPACIRAGAAGVAVIGALFAGAPDAEQVTARARALREAVASARAG